MQFSKLLPKISPNLGYIFTPRPSYFKVLDPPLVITNMNNKNVGDRDHEVLGMGSFGEYKLCGKYQQECTYYVHLVYQLLYKG
jgi:hypothetical protein